MSERTLEQCRAAHALAVITALQEKSYGNYVAYVEALPAAIVMNGLGQACATLLAKAKGNLDEPHRLLYSHLRSWLCGGNDSAPFKKGVELMVAIVESDQALYFQAQAEALAWLTWLKKFANAYLKRESGE